MDIDDIVAVKLKELCAKAALDLMERAQTEANKAGEPPDTLTIISLLRAANTLRRIGYSYAARRTAE